ncbi:NLR family CARD domain-containing protein 4-like [Amphiura filiformis]|uniref:NLR family CARD domain-containing protein 4-like n=1 Tax=Amphiura filiformis TaxID=82378 RepID=UPI003B21201A
MASSSSTPDASQQDNSASCNQEEHIASERDLDDVIELLDPTDLQKLFDALNIEYRYLKRAKKGAATDDADQRVKAVFRQWRKNLGHEATRQAILDALLRCGNTLAKDTLEEKWGNVEQIEHPLFGNDLILLRCREELKSYYISSLCKIPLFPGDMSKCVDLKDIYTKVSIVMDLPTPCSSIRIPLESHEEIFTRKTDDGQFYTRLLLVGPAGYGKTTTTAKIAYDWANVIDSPGIDSSLSDIGLLFVVNMRWVEHTSNLEDAILSQMLPEDTEMTKELLRSKIKELGDRVIIILDAVYESDRELFNHPKSSGSIVKLLRGNIFALCRLVVTTRPWRVAEIAKACSAFTRLDLSGFSSEDVQIYIWRFFRDDEELRGSLLEYMSQNALVADVSRVPLMALLVCTHWRESRAAEIPNRIGHLYDAILNIMYKHFQSKPRKLQASKTRGKKHLRFLKLKKAKTEKEAGIDFTLLLQHLGKMALEGLWPPNNRIVFSVNEVADPEVVEEACQMGLVSKQEMRAGHKVLPIQGASTSTAASSNTTKLAFFHKSAQEKCAGEYLANLADTKPEEFQSRLRSISTIQEALSIQLVLRFTCGRNPEAAQQILQRLVEIFRGISSMVEDYYQEEVLELDDTLMMQQFMELCLSCNYEAASNDRFTGLLEDVFVRGMAYFLGISSSTALALGYYMEHSQPGDIKSLKLRPIVHPGDYIDTTGPLKKLYVQYQHGVNQIPPDRMQSISEEYFSRYEGDVYSRIEDIRTDAPGFTVTLIQMWQRCQDHDLPTPEETDISPVINALQYTQLEALDIADFKFRDIDQFVEVCGNGHMSHLKELNVRSIGMDDYQTERLAQSISCMPDLEELDISHNVPGRSLEYLAETLPTATSLNKLYIQYMGASTEALDTFTQRLSDFGSQLIGLRMDGNYMNDVVASNLESHLPVATQLEWISIGMDNVSREHHNQLLLTMGRLTRLQQLFVYESQYPDDLLESIADVIPSLPDLFDVVLDVETSTSPEVSSTSWQHFKSKLQSVAGLQNVQLSHIALEKSDFMEFLQLSREKGLAVVRYDINCVPDDVAVPADDIFEFL